MPIATLIKTPAVAQSERLKRLNAFTALLCGLLPAIVLIFIRPGKIVEGFAGFLMGLVWANGFEYLYHRYALHRPKLSLARDHLLHHAVTGTPEAAEHIAFGTSPAWVVLLFAANGGLAFLLDWPLGLGLVPGMLVAFTLYYIVLEEIHWRIHLGGWLPPGLRRSRAYHLAHHDTPTGRFNVFIPLFDVLTGTTTNPPTAAPAARRP